MPTPCRPDPLLPPAGYAPRRPDEQIRVPEPASAQPATAGPQQATPAAQPSDNILANIERLADLRAKGILSDEEFVAKKTELLSRL